MPGVSIPLFNVTIISVELSNSELFILTPKLEMSSPTIYVLISFVEIKLRSLRY